MCWRTGLLFRWTGGRLGKWTDRNHVRSNNSRCKVLPQDGQAAGMRTGSGAALQNRPEGTNSSHHSSLVPQQLP